MSNQKPEKQYKDWYRIRELGPTFTKPWVLQRLGEGKLRARRVDGIVLVDGESVRELIESGTNYEPKARKNGGS